MYSSIAVYIKKIDRNEKGRYTDTAHTWLILLYPNANSNPNAGHAVSISLMLAILPCMKSRVCCVGIGIFPLMKMCLFYNYPYHVIQRSVFKHFWLITRKRDQSVGVNYFTYRCIMMKRMQKYYVKLTNFIYYLYQYDHTNG